MATEPYRHAVHIAAEPEQVFEYFTQSEAIVRWMGDYAVLDPRPNGEFTLDINGVPVRGRYLELDPPLRLVLSWGHAGSTSLPPGASTVEITLVREAGGTTVHVEHRDLPDLEARQHALGWPHFLERLVVAGAGRDPGPDPWRRTAEVELVSLRLGLLRRDLGSAARAVGAQHVRGRTPEGEGGGDERTDVLGGRLQRHMPCGPARSGIHRSPRLHGRSIVRRMPSRKPRSEEAPSAY